MKKTTLFLLSICCSFSVMAQEEHFTVSGHHFTFSETDTLLDGAQQRTLLIKEEGNSHKGFTFPLENVQADCNSESVMMGGYDLTDSTFVLYHFWAKAGDAPASPYGARQQTYTIQPDGSLQLAESLLYLEFGMPDKKLWQNYLTGNGHERILQGAEAGKLVEKVRNRLYAEWERQTGSWEERYIDSGFGYRR